MDLKKLIEFILAELHPAHFGTKNLTKKQCFILEDIKEQLKELKEELNSEECEEWH